MHNILHPGLILLAGALLLCILPSKAIKVVMPAAALCAFVAVFTLREGDGMFLQLLPQLRMQFLAVDRLSWAFVLIFAIGAVLAGLFACHTKNKFEAAAETAYAGSAMGVVLAGDWITMILFWEVMAIASWLVVISSRTEAASKAGFRYLLMHMLGGNLLLVGIVLKVSGGSFDVTCLTGSEDAAYWLMIAGTAVNAAIPPLHAWMPDAYPESTIGGTVYLGTYTTKVGIYTLIRLFAGTELLLYFGVFMALFGALMALLENDLRRLLSYHIISQLGYMVVSLALGTELGVDGAVAHVFGNILYKGTLFMCAGVILAATGKRKITEMGSQTAGDGSLHGDRFPCNLRISAFQRLCQQGFDYERNRRERQTADRDSDADRQCRHAAFCGLEAQLLCVFRGTARGRAGRGREIRAYDRGRASGRRSAYRTTRCGNKLARADCASGNCTTQYVRRDAAWRDGMCGDGDFSTDHAGHDAVSIGWTPVYGRSYHAVFGTIRIGSDRFRHVSSAHGAA